jgi:hypothetical protein
MSFFTSPETSKSSDPPTPLCPVVEEGSSGKLMPLHWSVGKDGVANGHFEEAGTDGQEIGFSVVFLVSHISGTMYNLVEWRMARG